MTVLRLSALVIVLVTAIGLYKKAWLPGWKLYTFPGRCSIRFRSSASVMRANSRVCSSLEQGLMVYGAWATSVPKPFSAASARNAATSAGSMALALLPRGLRVKN